MHDFCNIVKYVIMYDSCRSQVSLCMTPAGVKYVICMTPAGVDSCGSQASPCMTPEGVKYVSIYDSCRSPVCSNVYDSCRSQVSLCMTPEGVNCLHV